MTASGAATASTAAATQDRGADRGGTGRCRSVVNVGAGAGSYEPAAAR